MGQFTKDEWLNFVIENYKNIEDVNEVYNAAKKKLPEQVNLAVKDAILGLKESFFEENDLVCESEKEAISWFDRSLYDNNSGKGFYFALEDFDWDELVAESKTEAGWIYAYYEPIGKNNAIRTENREKWRTEFQKHKDSLKNSQIVINPDTDDPKLLAAYYLDREVNIDILKTEGELEKRVQKAVKHFTAAILPIMRKMMSK